MNRIACKGRINQLFERIEAQLRHGYCVKKRMREGEGYTTDETLLASQILAFCEGMLSRFLSASEFKYRPTDDFDARWPLIAAQLVNMTPDDFFIRRVSFKRRTLSR